MPFEVDRQTSRILNRDSGSNLEKKLPIPWSSSSEGSYVYYDCTLGVALDSGIVVHNRLPQVDRTPDTLGSIPYDDPRLNQFTKEGVNLRCKDQYTDIMQRMGHARYWFRLWGQAIRIGYKVPIPRIVSIGGVAAIPYDKNPQWAYNKIAPGGNYSGVILWLAEWSLWYTTLIPPTSNNIPAANPQALINNQDSSKTPPVDMLPPFSLPDDNRQNGPSNILGDLGIATPGNLIQ